MSSFIDATFDMNAAPEPYVSFDAAGKLCIPETRDAVGGFETPAIQYVLRCTEHEAKRILNYEADDAHLYEA